MKNRTFLAPAALFIALLTFCVPFLRPLAVTQGDVDRRREEYEQAQQRLDALSRELENAEQALAALAAEGDRIEQQLSALYAQKQDAAARLAQAQDLAAQQAAAQQRAQQEYDALYAQCRQHLAAMQEIHDRGAIAVLSQAADLYQLLTFSQMLQDISLRDDEMLDALRRKAGEAEQQRRRAEQAAALAESAAQALAQLETSLTDAAQQLAISYRQSSRALSEQQAEQMAQQALTAEAKQAYLQAAAELDALARRQSGKYTGPALHCSLDFRDPLSGGYYLSCLYGVPDYRGVAHHGTDLAAPGGTPVYAAADGIVSAAAAMRSYGNCVQISHGADDGGSTYDTLYAHLQSICVAEGQAVTKGDLIGYVGNTGDVVGANGGYHLHLELRVNGSRTDPQSYIPV